MGGPNSKFLLKMRKYLQERREVYKGVAHRIAISYLASY
jgi:hypothetical protein